MRGSVYFQTAQLTKMIFRVGSLKTQRIDPNHEAYKCIASFETMNSYRQIWNNFGNYLREIWQIKDFEKFRQEHVQDYLEAKLANGISKQYYEKITAALSKLEFALSKFSDRYREVPQTYIMKKTKKEVIAWKGKKLKWKDFQQNRAYSDPYLLISNISNPSFKIAAKIQLEGGARYKGIHKIMKRQLKGIIFDRITGTQKGVLETKEKGGRIGDVLIEVSTYKTLHEVLKSKKEFLINYQQYNQALKETCHLLHINYTGCHGLRWNFAKQRMIEYQIAGYTYDESMTKVSHEMKHNRKEITNRYLG